MLMVKVKNIAYSTNGNPIVLLSDLQDANVLPIWIGLLEAHAIVIGMQEIQMPRPLTHDLFKTVCEQLGARISKIIISDIHENTFLAEVHMQKGKKDLVFDARPSDAIALALRVTAPIYVSDQVAGHMLPIEDLISADDEEDEEDAVPTEKKLLN